MVDKVTKVLLQKIAEGQITDYQFVLDYIYKTQRQDELLKLREQIKQEVLDEIREEFRNLYSEVQSLKTRKAVTGL